MIKWLVAGNYLFQNPKYTAPTASRIVVKGGELVILGGNEDYEDILC